jgi:SAM-dependent methyltransferase
VWSHAEPAVPDRADPLSGCGLALAGVAAALLIGCASGAVVAAPPAASSTAPALAPSAGAGSTASFANAASPGRAATASAEGADAAAPAAPLAIAIAAVVDRPAEDEIPFIVTPDHVTAAMLEIAGVGPRDHLIDLGSGDGRIVITAARRFGASGLGVEIVPDLVERSRRYAERAGVSARVEFREQDLFTTDLAPASVVTMYLLPEINLRLRPRLLALAPGTRIVSHDWDMGDWPPDRTVVLPVPDKPVGRERLSRVHLWHVPAPIEGRWCAAAPDGTPREIDLRRRHQLIEMARLQEGRHDQGRAGSAIGRIDGVRARLQGLGEDSASLTWEQAAGRVPTLQITAAGGQWSAWTGMLMTPCPAPAEELPRTDPTHRTDRATRPPTPSPAARR